MKPDPAALCYSDLRTGMALAVFSEVADRLGALARDGASTAIDLRSMPLTEADLAELEELLGKGEVEASLEVAGPTRIWETAYPGAWWVRHLGAGGKVAAEHIAITPVPPIFESQAEDIAAAAERIRRDLDARTRGVTVEEAAHG